jgi:hypothetical protein
MTTYFNACLQTYIYNQLDTFSDHDYININGYEHGV